MSYYNVPTLNKVVNKQINIDMKLFPRASNSCGKSGASKIGKLIRRLHAPRDKVGKSPTKYKLEETNRFYVVSIISKT